MYSFKRILASRVLAKRFPFDRPTRSTTNLYSSRSIFHKKKTRTHIITRMRYFIADANSRQVARSKSEYRARKTRREADF